MIERARVHVEKRREIRHVAGEIERRQRQAGQQGDVRTLLIHNRAEAAAAVV